MVQRDAVGMIDANLRGPWSGWKRRFFHREAEVLDAWLSEETRRNTVCADAV